MHHNSLISRDIVKLLRLFQNKKVIVKRRVRKAMHEILCIVGDSKRMIVYSENVFVLVYSFHELHKVSA
jgi:hypothetical protein